MSRLKTIGLGGSCVAMLALAGCASTSVQNSWVAPDAPEIAFDNTLVVFISSSETTRRAAEDQLVQRIGPDDAVASHTVISQSEVNNTEASQAAIAAGGFDGAVVMRVIDQSQELTYTPGMSHPGYYGGFNSYYGAGWADTGSVRTDTIVMVETNVYSVTDDKLLWSGVTKTMNPNDIGNAVDDIADAVSRELRRHGLVSQPTS